MKNSERSHYSWHDASDDVLTMMAILFGATLVALAILAIGYIILEVFQEINQRIYPFDLL